MPLGGIVKQLEASLAAMEDQLRCVVDELSAIRTQGEQTAPTRFPYVAAATVAAGATVTVDTRAVFAGPLNSGHIANIGSYQLDVVMGQPGPPVRTTVPYPLLPGTTLELPTGLELVEITAAGNPSAYVLLIQ